jgi:hypothetical protein
MEGQRPVGWTSRPRLIIVAGILSVMVAACVDQSQVTTSSITTPASPTDPQSPDQDTTTIPSGASSIEATREDFPEATIIGVLAAEVASKRS